jgi:hypothetical protein
MEEGVVVTVGQYLLIIIIITVVPHTFGQKRNDDIYILF